MNRMASGKVLSRPHLELRVLTLGGQIFGKTDCPLFIN